MNSNAWDKFLLVSVAVIILGLSGLFVMKALGFAERFELVSGTPNDELPPTDTSIVNFGIAAVQQEQMWSTPLKGDPAPKPVPLFVSIPIVESDGVLIDMLDPNAPVLRPPVTNAWLMNNNLDFLNAGVLSQDPDRDGFTSLEEWNAKTAPSDPDSHPPYAEKIQMISRQQTEYKLKFSARPDSERFQIMRIPTAKWPQRANFYLRIGETSEDGQFRLDSFEERQAQSSVGIQVDASVLDITYLPTNGKFQLIRNVDTLIPTYFAELAFPLDTASLQGDDRYVKEGDAFNIVIDPETKYRVVEVKESSTVIEYQTGTGPVQTIEIPKK